MLFDFWKAGDATEEETKARQQAIQRAFHVAVEIPLQTMNACVECLQLIEEVAIVGNPSAFSDLKVAAYMCHTGAMGALENIAINLPSIKDQEFVPPRQRSDYLPCTVAHAYGLARPLQVVRVE